MGEEQFTQMSSFVNQKIRKLGEDILKGDIDVAPYKLQKKEACGYCPYHGVCGFDERMPGYQYRKLKKFEKDADILAAMREETKDGRNMDIGPEEGH